ncbi:helix-turn-helix transcriptional regulator [Micromonospora wenchangensis]|uniref:helix-turn-helix transcriptional regulator n=1 Tax=Micromonospora wenchangensis TaxID=1185415 RepID=UPI001181C8DC|nr:helix-turn-helix transcriptional regulator [Micromonospora wenchangensis]
MTGPFSSSPDTVTVADVRAARIVLQPAKRRFLEPFLGRSRSVAEAAREIGLPVEQAAYRVQAMLRAGLLRAVDTRARAGRAVTVYRAPAEIRAPLMVLPDGDARDFFRLVDEPMRETFLTALTRLAGRAGIGDWAVRLYRDDEDRVRVDLAAQGGDWDPSMLLAAGHPAVVFNWVPLSLTAADAKRLQGELMAVLARWAARVPTDGQPPSHQLGLFLTPLERA